MTERKTVPVAYVTKWAQTMGILVWKDAELSEGRYLYRQKRKGDVSHVSVSANHWTTDKAVAEGRYLAALKKQEKALVQKLKSVRQAWSDGPRFTEEQS